MNDTEPLLLDMREAAALVGVSFGTLHKEIMAGKLRTLRIGKRRLVSREAIADFIRAAEAAEATK